MSTVKKPKTKISKSAIPLKIQSPLSQNNEDSKKTIHQNLEKYFGFNEFKGAQEEIIENLLAGKDTFVIMPTGGGKSLCYQLPALMCNGVAIIVSPLIALMKNQVDLVRSYGSEDNIAHFLNSTLNKGQQKQVKEDLTSGKTKMLYVAPETLTKEENIEFFKSLEVSFFCCRRSPLYQRMGT